MCPNHTQTFSVTTKSYLGPSNFVFIRLPFRDPSARALHRYPNALSTTLHAALCAQPVPFFVSFEIPAFTIGRMVSDFRHWGGACGDAGCHLLMLFYASRRRSEKEKVLIYHYASPSSSSVFHVFIAVRLFAVFVEWIFHCLWLWLTVHWQSFRYRTMFYSYLSLIPAFNYSLLIMWTYNLMRFLCNHLLTSLQGCSSYC